MERPKQTKTTSHFKLVVLSFPSPLFKADIALVFYRSKHLNLSSKNPTDPKTLIISISILHAY